MSQVIRHNKFLMSVLVATLVVGGLTFSNLPSPAITAGTQVINGEVYNFNAYPSVNHESLALFNYLDELVTGQGYGSWNGWNAPDEFHGLLHYVLAFMAYATASLFDSTPGYRSAQYHDFAYSLIKRMNSSVAEFGNGSIEYTEWMHPSYNFITYNWTNPDNPNQTLNVGGFRGPANIMWTGHYALMMALYERNFNTGYMTNELSWFMEDWNNSLTTDGFGNPVEGGIWRTGLIPCEPYIIFVQCNSIPIYCTVLYDNLYSTGYVDSGMWDYGLDFINNVMQDQYGLFSDGYYVMEPTGYTYPAEGLPQEFPGRSQDRILLDGTPKVSAYGISWAQAFLECIQPNETKHDYPVYLEHFSREVSNDKMYMMDSYNNPKGFGTYDILGTLFTMALAKQQGDFQTLQRLVNFLYGSYNKVWSPDGRTMYYDTSSAVSFLQVPLAFGKIWASTPVTVNALADAHSSEFWSHPYISEVNDEDSVWVYQAVWDAERSAFILNIRVDQTATITFSNFSDAPTAYAGGVSMGDLSVSGSDYSLTLSPGSYNIVLI